MKLNLLNLLVLGSALTITAVGCKHPGRLTPLPGQKMPRGDGEPFGTGVPINNPGPSIDTTGPTTGGPSATGTGITPNANGSHEGWPEDHNALKSQTVYFDFDKATIRSSEQSKLEEVASYLKSNASAAVRVEGNCDERGTEEYNRSLGERRALAAREYLVRLGIEAGRVDTISYGEDKPANPGHNEAAWSKNRRDEFVVLQAPKP